MTNTWLWDNLRNIYELKKNLLVTFRVHIVRPSLRANDTTKVGVGENNFGIRHPSPAQDGILGIARYGTMHKRESCTVGGLPRLRRDHRLHCGVTNDVQFCVEIERSPTSEDEIYSSLNVAILEEMEASVITKCVLEP